MGAGPVKYRELGEMGSKRFSLWGELGKKIELLYPSHESRRENPRRLLRTLETDNLGVQSHYIGEKARPFLSCPAHLEHSEIKPVPPKILHGGNEI